jgi:hypothetical protein
LSSSLIYIAIIPVFGTIPALGDYAGEEIKKRLLKIRDKGDFAGVHMAPGSSADVADEQCTRLVVLDYKHYHSSGNDHSPALQAAKDILENRGGGPRQYRNTLVFVATEKNRVPELERAARQYLAWKSIDAEKEELNLDSFQTKQVVTNVQRTNETLDARIQEAYAYLLVPTQEGTGPIDWEVSRISGGSESMVLRANKKLLNAQHLITKWSPATLKMELDRWLWKESPHITIKNLWSYLTTYCYLPRLKDETVLMQTINDGICGTEYFAYAANITDEGKYQGLKIGLMLPSGTLYMDNISLLVKPEVALQQIEEEKRKKEAAEKATQGGATYTIKPDNGKTAISEPDKPEPGDEIIEQPKPKRFYGSVKLNSTRVGRDAGTIAQEVIAHLTSLMGADVQISLDITATIPEGAPDDVVRIVTENCRTLKFDTHGFEDE